MEPREQRGLVIAALCKLNKTDEGWIVPSQSGAERMYRVDPVKQTCTCPDHSEAGQKCKHLFAVEITMKREYRADGTVIETESVTFTKKRTYTQSWATYDRAQAIEKDRLQELLFDLCRGIVEPAYKGKGRPSHLVKDTVFASVLKVYTAVSARRVTSDLREAHEKGYTSKPIPCNKVSAFLENEALTPILHELIAKSAAPLKSVEVDFAVDSSGFSTCRYERWYDEKYGVTRKRSEWVKAHIACGIKTNVITAVRIFHKDSADAPQFAPLVRETAKTFDVNEVSADKAYNSRENFDAVAECGGTAYIAFKVNSTGKAGGMLAKMFHLFQYKQEEYMEHYHKRSNVESTFSMVKRKFGDSVRSKTDVAMKNEVLCKMLCHNLCCLIQAETELGIAPEFQSRDNERSVLPMES